VSSGTEPEAAPSTETVHFTLGQAAKATGKSKTAIALAIKGKKLSATKDAMGSWQIEATELYRLYPPRTDGLYPPHTEYPSEFEDLRAKLEGLKKQRAQIEAERNSKVEDLEKICRQIEGERDGLREQNAGLMALVERLSFSSAPS
jgi:hypothetical protein